MSEIASGAGSAWSYRAGAWFAVFGGKVTVLLPESQKDQVVSLWALVDGGAGFDEVLDGLLASGLSKLPGFVLVSTDDGPTRVLLRGQGVTATLTADGDDVTLDGAAGHTWVEHSVERVTALSVTVPDAEADGQPADFRILTGLVRVSRIDRPPLVASGEVDEEVPAEEMAPVEAAPEPAPEPDEWDPFADRPAVGGAMAGGAMAGGAMAGGAMTDDEPALDETGGDEPGEPPVAADPVMVEADPAMEAEVAGEPSPLDEPGPTYDEGPPTELMVPTTGDPLTDPLPADSLPPEQVEEPQQAAPDGWITPWDSSAPAAAETGETGETGEAGADDREPLTDQSEPLAEPDTPAFPPPAFPPVDGPTEVAPPGWSPPPPPSEPGVNEPPPLGIGSWEPLGGNYPPPPPAPAPPQGDADHDGLTVAGAGEQPAAPAPGIPGQLPAPAVTQPVAKLLISDGQTVVVDRAVLIGRAPEARRFTSTEQPQLVTVPSRLHEISSTHVEVRPGTGADHGTAVVTDMGSTNGTVLVQPGLGPEDLKPGIAVQLIPGAIINLGDGITIQVTRP